MCNWTRYGATLIGFGVLLGTPAVSLADDDVGVKTTEPAVSAARECSETTVTLSFKAGSSTVNSRGRKFLRDVAKWVKEDEMRTVRVEGHADDPAGSPMERGLGGRRAEATKRYLISQGI